MFRHLIALVVVLASTTWSEPALAQTTKHSIAVIHSGDDHLGQRLAFALREATRASVGYELAAGKDGSLRIYLVTLDPFTDESMRGLRTVASVTYTWLIQVPKVLRDQPGSAPVYFKSLVLIAGSDSIDGQAKSILASLDASLSKALQELKQ